MKRLLACVIAVAVLAACSSRDATPLPALGNVPALQRAAETTGTVKVTIVVPAKPHERAHYVSPSTKSITIEAQDSSHKVLVLKTFNLSATKKNCKAAPGGLACTLKFSVAAGNDRFSATTYGRPNAGGLSLATISNVERSVQVGKTTKLAFALDGIVRGLAMDLTGDNTLKNSNIANADAQFRFAGLLPQTVQLLPFDADGNIIVGAGSPTLSLTSNDTTHISISRVSGSTNEFLVTPHALATGISLTALATSADGAKLYDGETLAIVPLLYVANGGGFSAAGSVTAYAPWSSSPVETIASGIDNPGALVVDRSGNLWVANQAADTSGAGSITKYAPGSLTPSRTISGLTEPNSGGGSLAVDASGNVYCACSASTEVDEFTPAGGSTAYRSLNGLNSPSGISMPYSVAVDTSGNLYVANETSNAIGISVYGPTGVTPIRNITSGINSVALLAFDKLGNLYAANYASTPPATITEYASGSSTVANTFESAGLVAPVALAVDSAGDVYASNFPGASTTTALEYTQTSTGSPARTFTESGSSISGIAVDAGGNVYIPVSQKNVVYVYLPGTSTQPTRTLTSADAIANPQNVVTWP